MSELTFADLIHVYRKIGFVGNSVDVEYWVESAEELALLKRLDKYYERTGVTLNSDNNGSNVSLSINTPKASFARVYADVENFIDADIRMLLQTNRSAYYIQKEKISSLDEQKSGLLQNYLYIQQFLEKLQKMGFYTDISNNKLIFFSKKKFELCLEMSIASQVEFKELIKDLDEHWKEVIINFTQWLDDEETSSHMDEKKSILAFVLSDVLEASQTTLCDMLKNIAVISESVQAQYALYLENFSYQKFVKALEENSGKFVSQVNDTINKLLPQFLGLPLLTAVPTALKSADNYVVYIALVIYCVICHRGLRIQNAVLEHISDDVEHYEKKGKIPEKLREQWNQDKQRIQKLIGKQKELYYILTTAVVICGLYSLYKLGVSLELCDWLKNQMDYFKRNK